MQVVQIEHSGGKREVAHLQKGELWCKVKELVAPARKNRYPTGKGQNSRDADRKGWKEEFFVSNHDLPGTERTGCRGEQQPRTAWVGPLVISVQHGSTEDRSSLHLRARNGNGEISGCLELNGRRVFGHDDANQFRPIHQNQSRRYLLDGILLSKRRHPIDK